MSTTYIRDLRESNRITSLRDRVYTARIKFRSSNFRLGSIALFNSVAPAWEEHEAILILLQTLNIELK
jgi:hypothetical protein